MKSFIIYCPHLNRDIRGILNAVPNPQIVTGEQTERGEDGCLQCHQQIVRHAKDQDWPMVFVMEDDCHFTQHFSWEKWMTFAQYAQMRHYDVLVGGCTRTYGERLACTIDGHAMLQVEAFHSAHCIVYFASGYDKVLQTVQPLDLSIGQQGATILLTWPFLAVQAPSFSGILKKPVDYVPEYEAHERRLGHALGLLQPQIPMPQVY